jgi:hypothetical protein
LGSIQTFFVGRDFVFGWISIGRIFLGEANFRGGGEFSRENFTPGGFDRIPIKNSC